MPPRRHRIDRSPPRPNGSQCTGLPNDRTLKRRASRQKCQILYPTDADFEYVGTEKYAQIRERGIGTVETHWQHKDGHIIDVLLSSVPLNQEDLAAGVTFAALDITERKRTETALRASEARLQSIFRTAPIGIGLLSVDRVHLHATKQVGQIIGRTSEEVIGKSVRFFYPTEEDFQYVGQERDRQIRELAWQPSKHGGCTKTAISLMSC